jgi:hypothetical protein
MTEYTPEMSEAGAPEIEINPAMLRAGAEAAAGCLDEYSASFCELVAREVYQSMKRAKMMASALDHYGDFPGIGAILPTGDGVEVTFVNGG